MIAHGIVLVTDEELPRSIDCVAAEELVEDIDDAEVFQTTEVAYAADVLGPTKF